MEGFLKYFFISSIGFCIIGGLGRKSENHGFDGAWGKHGILMEFMNLEIIMVSLGVGAFITLLFFLAIRSLAKVIIASSSGLPVQRLS
jgi:hypothetical protein